MRHPGHCMYRYPEPEGLRTPMVFHVHDADEAACPECGWPGAVSQGFGWALSQLEAGRAVRRAAWIPKGIFLGLRHPDGEITLPFIVLHRSGGDTAPWLACHNDLLAKDWVPATATQERKD